MRSRQDASEQEDISSPKKRLEVLLVEDNPGDAQLVDVALRETGARFRLTLATDGEQALELLGQLATGAKPLPNLILLDLNLPRVDGLDLLRHIKTDPLLKKIPVVMLTTSSASTDIEACYELQANSFVTKPIDLPAFFGRVEEIASYWLDTARLPSAQITKGTSNID